jgi:hypothetical protein
MSAVKGGWAHENDRFNRRLQKMIAHRCERNLKDVRQRLPSGTTPADRSRHIAGPRNPSSLDFFELDVQRVRFGVQKKPKQYFRLVMTRRPKYAGRRCAGEVTPAPAL